MVSGISAPFGDIIHLLNTWLMIGGDQTGSCCNDFYLQAAQHFRFYRMIQMTATARRPMHVVIEDIIELCDDQPSTSQIQIRTNFQFLLLLSSRQMSHGPEEPITSHNYGTSSISWLHNFSSSQLILVSPTGWTTRRSF